MSASFEKVKFIEPPLLDAISGLKRGMTASLSSTVMLCAPPVVIPITTSLRFFMPESMCSKVSCDAVGEPSSFRAWICTIDAPAFAASTAWLIMSSGVFGRYFDIDGVWIPPVIAALTTTFFWAFGDITQTSSI
jgi:hypothetical protein